ncbi:LuxR C-terminal-related transcriptional regulator [Paenarthrobacter sp. NPDC092416]|uniref:LuxR C-terminal-related transcriptional regulator n=1 Tax=Paenarthrobacter sp. NPDC092416 TaxID=3364386 RepID=UPI00380710A7
MTMPATALDLGRSAFSEHRWSDALDCLARADSEGGLTAPDMELVASVAMLLGHDADGVEYLTRAHQEFLTLGDMAGAARCAAWLVLYLMDIGEPARSSGWMSRAQHLIAGMEEPTEAEGYLLIPAALGALYGGDPTASDELFGRAFEVGQRFHDRDLTALGQLGLGTARITLGFPDEGLQLLDEVMLSVTAGEVSPIPSGIIYCAVIGSCRLALDVHRAQEWTAALERWCGDRPDMVMFSGQCQSHRAELFILHGAWDDALAAARIAQDRSRRGDPEAAWGAWYQQGEVLRLRGSLEEAEAAYAKAGETGFEPLPGLALLRMAQHKTSQAQVLLRRAMSGADPANRCRLLPAVVQVELAEGDLVAARAAADELAAPVHEASRPLERALAAQAEASVLLAEGSPEAALISARKAWRIWYSLEAPYDAARCRVLAGRACAVLGDPDSAIMEFEAAKGEFAELGALPAAAEVLGLTGERPTGQDSPLTARELEVLRLVAEGNANKAIARSLYLSEKTVARHVSNILTKLTLPSRVAATRYAFEHHLFN